MLVPITPRVSLDSARPPGLFDLPLELKEQIYEYCVCDVVPQTYVIYRHAQASNWFFRQVQDGATPPLLLVCRAMRREVLDVLDRITDGPLLLMNPTDTGKRVLYDKADETQPVFDLEPTLASLRKLRLEINFPEDMATQARVLVLLRWFVVVLNARAAPIIKNLAVDVLLGTHTMRIREKDSLWRILDSVRCGRLRVVCVRGLYKRQDRCYEYFREEVRHFCGRRDGSGGDALREGCDGAHTIEAARQALLVSCGTKKWTWRVGSWSLW